MTETLSASIPTDLERRIEGVLKGLCERDWTIATAESCTGGLIASVLTDVSGLGHAFDRAFVTYTEAAKIQAIEVPPELISAHTAVSPQVAEAMARGALRNSEADIALSVTGYAGPGGEDDEEGLVFLCLADRDGGMRTRENHFGPIGRGAVRIACVEAAVALLEGRLSQA